MGVSENRGIPKSSILIGFSLINHPFWGTPIFGNTHTDYISNTRNPCINGKSVDEVMIIRYNSCPSKMLKTFLGGQKKITGQKPTITKRFQVPKMEGFLNLIRLI